ncbi:MAG TPA: AAA family ATPase [Xanthomonadales bacterium]|nr:AAA family ATPase [Xanthomonadales bacterium]
MGELKSDLARGCELIETHISWVFLHGQTVIKVKKPVSLGFLDFSTLDQRRQACEQEYVLNQRLSRDVYLDVVPITLDADGTHRVDGSGAIVDYAVRMRRLDDAHRADVLLRKGQLRRDHMHRLATRLASFHAGAERSAAIDSFGSLACIRQNVLENFAQAQGLNACCISQQQEREIENRQLGFLEQHRDLFEQRIRAGRICDGHGDLRLEHIYLAANSLDIIDCIEFNERFRYADVCADLTFLVMDLAHQGRADLAEDLLADYAQCSGDYDLYALADFYTGYRAYVRAKVASFLASDEQAGADARAAAEHNARGYYLHALSAQREPLTAPMLIAVGGLIASGKSHTSRQLSHLLHCPAVDTDRTRKHLLGVGFETRVDAAAFSEAYGQEFTARVYAEVLRRAEAVLNSRRSVIIDATFRSAAERGAARQLATRLGLPFCFIECQAPRGIALQRLQERARAPSVSDARVDIYDEFARTWEPVTELDPAQWLTLDTSLDQSGIEAILRERFAPDGPQLHPGAGA